MILDHYTKTLSSRLYVTKIVDTKKADCLATGFLKVSGFRSIVENSPVNTPLDDVQAAFAQSESKSDDMSRAFWRCLSIAELVRLEFGDNGDCCVTYYPEATLGCLRNEFAKMDREVIYDELIHSHMSQPLGAKYASTVTKCGVSLPE